MGGCVWYGNDDNAPMNNMTGGTLPAGTWHDIMAYAHQGATLKPIVGLKPDPKSATAVANANVVKPIELGAPQRPATLSKGAIQALESIQTKIKAVGGDKQSALESPERAAFDAMRHEAQRANGAADGVMR
jgi:penicillin-binding protein 1A